jgi:hypothetical protein
MNVSLIEMVLAIALSGLILASAILPTTQVMVTYQQAEWDWQTMLAHAAAALRVEQLLDAIWRDPNAPGGHAALGAAQAHQIQVGNWELRANGTQLQQQRQSGGWAQLVAPAQAFAFRYLLGSGEWKASVGTSKLGDVVAARFDWTDPDSGLPYGGVWVLPDHSFSAGLISVYPTSTAPPYYRSDYEQTMTLSLGTWP